jgi:hypothetical protein
MADRKQYNGLHLPGGVQVPIGSQMSHEERQQQAFNQQHQALAREIFVRAASTLIDDTDIGKDEEYAVPASDHFEELSRLSQIAAKAYFLGFKAYLEAQQAEQQPAIE